MILSSYFFLLLIGSIVMYLSFDNQNILSKSLSIYPWRLVALVIWVCGCALASSLYSAAYVALTFMVFTMLLFSFIPFVAYFSRRYRGAK